MTCCEPTVIGKGPAKRETEYPSVFRTDVTPLIITADADGAIEIL